MEELKIQPEMNLWVEEIYRDYYGMRYRVKQTLYSGRSEFQKVDVVETVGHGRMLLNDGLVMVTERDEFVYHDMIAHVPLFVHPHPEKVLVIGGGDGGTAREVIRHPEVKKCQMVEIDPLVIEACRKFIPVTAMSMNDPKVNVKVDDGIKFVKETDEKFDVVIVDSTDPIGPAAPLFGPEFYSNVKRVLNPNGIVVSQGENPYFELETQKSMVKVLKGIFPVVHIYNFSNLTYPGGLWSFTFASDGLCPIKDFYPERVRKSGLKFRYYNERIHRSAFCLPQFMEEELRPHLSSNPVFND